MIQYIEVSHAPWTVRLEKKGQFPDIQFLLSWLRERVAGARPPSLAEVAVQIQEQWPDRRFRVAQAQKIGVLLVEG